MSEASPTTPRSPATPPLDEVMLAMDVVDTLRAERALVEAELDDEARARTFAERVKSIYATQGIDVPDAVIAEAVQALEQDRFTYEPPERTFQVRLAELYVDRATWFRRAAVVLAIAALVWGGVAWTRHRRARKLVAGFAAKQTQVDLDVQTAAERVDELARRIALARQAAPGAPVTADLLDAADRRLGQVRERAAALASAPALDPEAYPEASERLDAALAARRRALGGLEEGLANVAGQLDAVQRLQGLGGRIAVALAEAAGVQVSDAERERLEGLRGQAEAALRAGDAEAAERHVSALREAVGVLVRAAALRQHVTSALLAAEADLGDMTLEPAVQADAAELASRVRALLDAGDVDAAASRLAELQQLAQVLGLAYELRIVSRPGEQSGIWRYPEDRPNVRNHYIVVEPVGPGGQVLAIPVVNEEDQITRTVRRFAVRVPESVYETVKADKLDNGIVDASLFGVKRRGARLPAYRYEVAGGWITDW